MHSLLPHSSDQLHEVLDDDFIRPMLAHPQACATQVSIAGPDACLDCEAVGCEVFGMKEMK